MAAVGLLLSVAFVFVVAEGGGSVAVSAFGVAGAVLLGVGGVFVGVVGALTDSVAAVALLAVTGSTLVGGSTSGVDGASGGAVLSDPPLLVAWIAVAGWVGGVSVCVVGALIDSVAAVAPVAVTGSTPVTGLTSAVDGALGGAVLSDPPLLLAWIAVAGWVRGVWVPPGADAVVVLLLGSSVAPLGVTAVPGLGLAELPMWLGVAVVPEVVPAGGLVPEVPEGLEVFVLLLVGELALPVSAEGLEVFVLLLVGELALPVSAWTTAGVAAVSAIPTPKAAASPPIRPTKWAYSVMPILPRCRQRVVWPPVADQRLRPYGEKIPTFGPAHLGLRLRRPGRVLAGGSATAAAVLKSTCCSVISAVSVEVGGETTVSRLSSSPGPDVVAMSVI